MVYVSPIVIGRLYILQSDGMYHLLWLVDYTFYRAIVCITYCDW